MVHPCIKRHFTVDEPATPGMSRPLRGDSAQNNDDGVTLPEDHVEYLG